jgi:hypothetical protein
MPESQVRCTVAADRKADYRSVITIPWVRSFDGWDHRLGYETLQAVFVVFGVSSLSVGVNSAVAVGSSYNERRVAGSGPGVKVIADALGKDILGFPGKAVQYVEHREGFGIRSERTVDPHLPLVSRQVGGT